MKYCYIVGAGDFDTPFTPREDELVIAADGGYAHLIKNGIRCDLFVGDADSLGYLPSEVECVIHKVEKDETDMHLAYLEGKKRGCTAFKIHGGTGGRIDHTIANFSLLSFIRNEGYDAELYGTGWAARLIKNENVEICGECGKTVSVFAFGGTAHGVYISGLKYEASGATLSPSFPLGVSNSFTDSVGRVSVECGELLIIYEL